MTTIGQVAGSDHISALRLRRAGIKTAEAFLERVREPDDLQLLSQETGIDCDKLLDLAASIDLLRLVGMGGRYCALLRTTGIHTMEDLRGGSVEEILNALTIANHQHRIVKRLPSLHTVRLWVQQASQLNTR